MSERSGFSMSYVGFVRVSSMGRVLLGTCMAVGAPLAWAQNGPQASATLFEAEPEVGDIFGYSVAIAGDTAVIGAVDANPAGINNAGMAFVFVRNDGVWTQQQTLAGSSPAIVDQFGWSVAISGDTALVGAPYENPAAVNNAGSAYVFIRSGGSWAQQQRLNPLDSTADDLFGTSVAVSGDTAVVGAHRGTVTGAGHAGSAYVFVRSGTVWTQVAKLTASDPASGNGLGFAIAMSDDTVVVGANYVDLAGLSNAGAAYVFVKPLGGWADMNQTAKLTASDATAGSEFGASVAVSSDTVIVGARYDNHAGGTASGAAYVFVKPEGGWSDEMNQTAKLTASDATANDWFGFSVGLSGNTAVVGAHRDDHGGGVDAGSAYVFARLPEGWANTTETTKVIALDPAASERFGFSVALDGDTGVIGAPYDTPTGVTESGSAFVFTCVDECDDGDACTHDECAAAFCSNSPRLFGDVSNDGMIDIFDILCVLDGFAGVYISPCTKSNLDLAPCSGDDIIDIFDVLAVLDAFAGNNLCNCPAGP